MVRLIDGLHLHKWTIIFDETSLGIQDDRMKHQLQRSEFDLNKKHVVVQVSPDANKKYAVVQVSPDATYGNSVEEISD